MLIHLTLDENLLLEAQRLGGHRSKKETVIQALSKYIERHKQQEILKSFGKVVWAKGYSHRSARKSRSGRSASSTIASQGQIAPATPTTAKALNIRARRRIRSGT